MELNIIHNLDALSGLSLLPDESVDCIVTSPPYWQMRDYGIGSIVWGGNGLCVHEFDEKGYCSICGAWLGQLGLEPTRDNYIHHLVMIFDQCKRVLKPQGTLWVNLGDTYANPANTLSKPTPRQSQEGIIATMWWARNQQPTTLFVVSPYATFQMHLLTQ